MRLRYAGIALLAVLFALCGAGAAGSEVEFWQTPPQLEQVGTSSGSFFNLNGKALAVHCYRSREFEPDTGPIWFVMHGASRAVERYLAAAAPIADRYDALVVAIHFDREHYPKHSDYSCGIERKRGSEPEAPGQSRWLPPEQTPYQEVERMFDAVVALLDGEQEEYYLFGHSAGAQFVHRLLTFLPEHRVQAAVAANAGWYTLPVASDPKLQAMPYGLVGYSLVPDQLKRLFATQLTVLLGEHDLKTAEQSSMVRGTPEAQAQGLNRFERGHNYFRVAAAEARSLEVPFVWQLVTVPDAGHRVEDMIEPAGELLFARPEPLVPESLIPESVVPEQLPAEAAGAAGGGR